MIFKYGIQYELDNDFTNKELGDITPAVIVRRMCHKIYVNPDHNPKKNPTQVLSSYIAYANKAISYFILIRFMHWNELENPPVGNPTKSIPVNDLIKRVKIRRYENKAKRRRLGKRSRNKNTKWLSKKCIDTIMLRSEFLCHQFLDFKWR